MHNFTSEMVSKIDELLVIACNDNEKVFVVTVVMLIRGQWRFDMMTLGRNRS